MNTILISTRTSGQVKRITNMLPKTQRRLADLPKLTRKGMRAWGNLLVRSMSNSIKYADIKKGVTPNGGLKANVKWEQGQNSNTGILTAPLYGIYLDSMRTHNLYFHKDQGRLLKWGAQANSATLRQLSRDIRTGKKVSKNYITVHKHPWIRRGLLNARKKLPAELRSVLNTKTI